MRILGTIMMGVGAFAMGVAILATMSPLFHAGGIQIVANVPSVPGTLIGGAISLVVGALLRRRETRLSTSTTVRFTLHCHNCGGTKFKALPSTSGLEELLACARCGEKIGLADEKLRLEREARTAIAERLRSYGDLK